VTRKDEFRSQQWDRTVQCIFGLKRPGPIERVRRGYGLERQECGAIWVDAHIADGGGRQLARRGHPPAGLCPDRPLARLIAEEGGLVLQIGSASFGIRQLLGG